MRKNAFAWGMLVGAAVEFVIMTWIGRRVMRQMHEQAGAALSEAWYGMDQGNNN